MSNKEIQDFNEKLRRGLEIAEKKNAAGESIERSKCGRLRNRPDYPPCTRKTGNSRESNLSGLTAFYASEDAGTCRMQGF